MLRHHTVRTRSLRFMSVGVALVAFLRLWETAAFVVLTSGTPSRRRAIDTMLAAQADGIGIGIDLGTTFSAVAYLDEGIPTIVPVDGERTMPSVVRFDTKDGWTEVVVGRRACASLDAYRNVKRVIGTGGNVQRDVAAVVPHVRVNAEGKTYKKDSLQNRVDDATLHPTKLVNASHPSESFSPEIVSSYIIERLKEAVKDHTGREVTRAVIGVPAYFNDAQREATIVAAQRAGIPKVKLLREPEAAALAYKKSEPASATAAHTEEEDPDELVLVFDLGGGTFDVSMLVVGGGITEVLCTSGNTQLGGSDFDGRIAQHLLEVIRERGGATTHEWSRKAQNAVLLAAESVRIHLSNNREASLALPIAATMWEDMVNPKVVLRPNRLDVLESVSTNSTHVLITLSRQGMERLCRKEFQSLLRPIREVAIMAGALLPGDSSPTIVDAALEVEDAMNSEYDDFFPAEEVALLPSRGQDELLRAKKSQQQGRKKARDIAKQERKFRTEKQKLSTGDLDGAKVRDGISGRPISRVVLVGGATRMPAIGRLLTALTGVTPQKTVNPDEAVALGCAVQVGVLDGDDQFGKVLNPMQAAILRAMAEQASSQQFEDD